MATKRYRSGSWHFTVRRKILEKPIYLSFKDEVEGDNYVYKLEKLLDKGIIPEGLIKTRSRTLGAVIHDYQTMNHIKPDDDKLLNLIYVSYQKTALTDVTYHWAELFVSKMKREHNLSPGTIRHYVGALARCLDWALAKEYIKINPLRQLPKGYAQYSENDAKYAPVRHDIEKDRRLEGDEEKAIRNALNGDLLLYFEIGLETGMRLSEIYSLELNQIDISQKTIFLNKTKNGHKRQVPINSQLLPLLQKLVEFPTLEKSNVNTSRLSKQFSRKVAEVAPGFTFHCLRHEFTSRLFERTTLSPFEIAKITGHSGERVLGRYANLRGSNLAEKLW